MGSIEIPSININLPIYHGTSDEVLSAGVGHLNGSSLPIGGVNIKSILTAHRGLPSSKLFTRLDELVEGDLFFIRVLNETLAYKVNDIQVIDPEDVAGLEIEEGKDLVSLITCTPYGLNTHRLVVTGERTEYEPAIYENIESKNMSIREYVFLAIPFVFLTIIVGRRIKSAKKKLKVLVSTLILLSVPISVMASPRAIISDSVIINKGDGSVVIPPSEVLDEILNNETSLSNKGSITIKLANVKNNQSKEGVEFSISKIADIEDGLYKVKEDYKGVEVDLNNIKTANDLELAAELFKKVAKTDNLMKTNANGECNIEDLDVGVYLVYAKNIANYDNITPFIVSIPSWNETDKSMSYDIQVIPKHTEIIKKIRLRFQQQHMMEIQFI